MMEMIPMWDVQAQTAGGDVFSLRVSQRDLEAVLRSFIYSDVSHFEARPETTFGTAQAAALSTTEAQDA